MVRACFLLVGRGAWGVAWAGGGLAYCLDGQVPPKFEKESFLSVVFRGWSAVFVIIYRRKIENPDFRRYITAHKTVWRQKTTVKISEDLILAVVCLAPTD